MAPKAWTRVAPPVVAFVLGGGVVAAFFSTHKPVENSPFKVQGGLRYSCPMHPSITADHPDKCPICGMDLQRVDDVELPKAASEVRGKPLYYRHPMRGEITSLVPAKDEMGMDYIPVYPGEDSGGEKGDVRGRAAFSLSNERQQLIGVTTAKVDQPKEDVPKKPARKAARSFGPSVSRSQIRRAHV